MLCQPSASLRRFFQPVGDFQANVVLLGLPHFPVDGRSQRIAGGVPNGVGQFGGGLRLVYFLKEKPRLDFPGFRVQDRPFDLLFGLGYLLPRRLRLVRRLSGAADALAQLRVQLGIRKLEAGIFLHTAASAVISDGFVVMIRYSSVSLGKRSTKGRMMLP